MLLKNTIYVQYDKWIFIFIEILWYFENYQNLRQIKIREDPIIPDKMRRHPDKKVSFSMSTNELHPCVSSSLVGKILSLGGEHDICNFAFMFIKISSVWKKLMLTCCYIMNIHKVCIGVNSGSQTARPWLINHDCFLHRGMQSYVIVLGNHIMAHMLFLHGYDTSQQK